MTLLSFFKKKAVVCCLRLRRFSLHWAHSRVSDDALNEIVSVTLETLTQKYASHGVSLIERLYAPPPKWPILCWVGR